MVSFSCEGCGDVLTKKKLDGHRNQCYGASFTCLDCMVHFPGTSYKSHTACITEDQKYQGKLYKEKKKPQKRDSAYHDNSQALASQKAHVEDARDEDNAVAVVNAPPRAPTPPPAAHSLGYYEHEQAAIEAPNVFDFLDASETPKAPRTKYPIDESRMLEDSQPPAYEQQYMPAMADVMQFQVDDEEKYGAHSGSYGEGQVRPSRERFDSYTTPASKPKHTRTKSGDTDIETTTKTDRKRKRNSPAELDLSLARAQDGRDAIMTDATPSLHSGLTGGLHRMLAPPEFPPSPDDSGDYANSPLSPMKRAKQGDSKTLMRAQREYEKEQQKQRKANVKAREKAEKKEKDAKEKEKKEKKEREAKEKEKKEKEKEKEKKDRGRDRDRKERKATTALVKIRPKKKREDSTTEVRRIRRRQYSSSVSPAPLDRKAVKAIEYNPSTSDSEPDGEGQLIIRPNGDVAPFVADPRAELFMSFVSKGPDSERGISVNKALKRFHRERNELHDSAPSKAEEEKELWKNMRLKKNDRGEIVLFFAPGEASPSEAS
ncbi:hypothetical protein PTNB73_03226 [Pyrenophora teres f. teres]|uniref:Zinc finger C2H2 LYAR-type domain-containing protein n=2 Tax=Pyrenophora teres f. teres TaxID=97479 RepID=E3S9C8_PYRTT|nr:hypothetical protein PTT_19630 [Pyrenophora teres f. teres 0-1]KAE8838754.1 hypothetical protein HRS9139_03137 [Pyrenophora teres f. teres]KAE8844719.1 hypothetical protein PTNB85_02984 [Pyrenophora teres f. teres]KAE8866132.1 hypothetical protein PTNB29_03279 [Pyrenophora teres f. teres]KAE8871767.1 hypothetical protein PTNB73_03226 [Pyrenophora teres f. teres]